MSSNYVFFHAFWHASLIVKLVMILLLATSILSWTIILYQRRSLRLLWPTLDDFNHLFTNEQNVIARYQAINHHQLRTPLEKLFVAGFDEHLKLKQQGVYEARQLMKGAKRIMNIISLTEIEQLEQGLATLATIGSVSPYVGLFGTVWGIMSSFHALQGSHAGITSIAPGISEALIATAMGLFAAIPAVIAYNRFTSIIDRIINRFDLFQQQFANYLYHQNINQEDHQEQNHDIM